MDEKIVLCFKEIIDLIKIRREENPDSSAWDRLLLRYEEAMNIFIRSQNVEEFMFSMSKGYTDEFGWDDSELLNAMNGLQKLLKEYREQRYLEEVKADRPLDPREAYYF